MGLERNVPVEELVALGLNISTAKMLFYKRQRKSVLKATTSSNNGRHSKGGYALDKNGAPMDKSLLKSKPIW